MSDAWNIDPISHANHTQQHYMYNFSLTCGRNLMQNAFVIIRMYTHTVYSVNMLG